MKRRGKKITVWTFNEHGRKYEVPVRMEERASRTVFHASVDELNIDLSNGNMDELKVELVAAIRAAESFKLEPQLYITVIGEAFDSGFVDSSSPKDRLEVVMRLRVEMVSTGRRADGTAVHIQHSQDTRVRNDHPDVGYFAYNDYEGELSSLVPDTREHRQALAALANHLKQAFEKLMGRLQPSEIDSTITLRKIEEVFTLPTLPVRRDDDD